MKQHGTLYRLVDGTQADPDDCSTGKDGLLRHKNGLAVAMRETGEPETVGDSATLNKNSEAAAMGRPQADEEGVTDAPKSGERAPADAKVAAKPKAAKPTAKDLKAGKAKPGDKTREAKAG